MMKWLTSCLLPRQRETKCRQKRPGLGWDSLKFSFHSLTTLLSPNMLYSKAFSWSYPESPKLSIVPSTYPIKCGECQTQKIAVREITGFKRKSFTQQNSPDSKVIGFKVPILNSGFKISAHDLAGEFLFRTRPLAYKRQKQSGTKTRSEFVTNPEQFPLV